MPDHVHFLLQGKGIVDFIRQFKGKLTPQARAVEPGRKLWQRSFFDHALRKEESLIFGKTLYVQRLLKNHSIMRGPDPRSG